MSETYENYAQKVYATVFGALQEKLRNNGIKPVMIVSGESHKDDLQEKFADMFRAEEDEQPALASAYVHEAAMLAAEKLVGKNKMIVSFEQDGVVLEEIARRIRLGQDPGIDTDNPMAHALVFAVQHKFRVEGTDAGVSDAIRRARAETLKSQGSLQEMWDKVMDDPKRYIEERKALNALADNLRPPRIVVHIGGAAHIQMLQGFGPTQNAADMSEAERAKVANPFEKTYGRPIFVNSCDRHSDGDVTDKFINSARNAIQLHAPGAMDAEDRAGLDERIQRISNEFSAPGLPPALQQQAPAAAPARPLAPR